MIFLKHPTGFFILAVSVVAFYSCSKTPVKQTPQDVIRKYERLVLEMKADSIAQLFTTDAEIGHGDQPVVKGRDSIYSLLSSFNDVQVIDNKDEIISSTVRKDTAIVNGNHEQTVILSRKDTVNVSGRFTATLTRNKNNDWLICKMKTRSH